AFVGRGQQAAPRRRRHGLFARCGHMDWRTRALQATVSRPRLGAVRPPLVPEAFTGRGRRGKLRRMRAPRLPELFLAVISMGVGLVAQGPSAPPVLAIVGATVIDAAGSPPAP